MADVFDSLLNKLASVYKLDSAAGSDDYGQPKRTLTLVQDNVPCRVSILNASREYKAEKLLSIDHYRVFMRPMVITEHNILQIEGLKYNILNVSNPGGMNHHLELRCELVKP